MVCKCFVQNNVIVLVCLYSCMWCNRLGISGECDVFVSERSPAEYSRSRVPHARAMPRVYCLQSLYPAHAHTVFSYNILTIYIVAATVNKKVFIESSFHYISLCFIVKMFHINVLLSLY